MVKQKYAVNPRRPNIVPQSSQYFGQEAEYINLESPPPSAQTTEIYYTDTVFSENSRLATKTYELASYEEAPLEMAPQRPDHRPKRHSF